ncbi:M81 family metallopeptidase [Bordetella sp. BOR01]|uniref:M81 family metallopeptidase n=1 Tax=Bordetella sp. BOR01 TaxID=2854779 RepID=UPI001C471A68|nr:M81 family metallopeptidase [Bordetella sp. BOR01]MBV7482339.1 M81 family metallopeptidase [Bordetella sp. BOR01]
MNIAIAGFHIESVSFLPVVSTYADFEQGCQRGTDIVTALRGTNTVIGGFIEVCEQEGARMLPILNAYRGALGPASDEAIERYADEIATALRAERGKLDGVLLHLHGASWAPSYLDPEHHIIDTVRAAIGPDLPLVVAFDYHGNLDARTLQNLDAAFAYQQSPHTDMGDTGRRAACCLVRTLRGEIRPSMAIAKPGVLVPSIFSATALPCLAGILAQARELERAEAGYMDISVMAGFSYADAPNTGFAVLCVTDAAPERARQVAEQLSARIHAQRRELYHALQVLNVKQAVDYVLAHPAGKPYVLLEHADRMNDSTYVLAELLARHVESAAVPFVMDPQAAQRAAEIGAGRTGPLELGGWTSERAGPRLTVEARVLQAGPMQFRVSGRMNHGMPVDLGPSALLQIGGVSVSVTSNYVFGVDEDPFRIFGLKSSDFDIIVLRSKTHFRHHYEPLAQEILIVDTPDYGPADLTTLPYRHADRQAYPFCDHPS